MRFFISICIAIFSIFPIEIEAQILIPSHQTYLRFYDFGYTIIIFPNGKIMKFNTYPGPGLLRSVNVNNKCCFRYGIAHQKVDTVSVNKLFAQLDNILDSVTASYPENIKERIRDFDILDDNVTHGGAENLSYTRKGEKIFHWSYFRSTNNSLDKKLPESNAIAFLDTIISLGKSANWENWDGNDIFPYEFSNEITGGMIIGMKWDYKTAKIKKYKPRTGRYRYKKIKERFPAVVDTMNLTKIEAEKLLAYLKSGTHYCPFNKKNNKIDVEINEFYRICLFRKKIYPFWWTHDNTNLRIHDFEWHKYDLPLSEFLKKNEFQFKNKSHFFTNL